MFDRAPTLLAVAAPLLTPAVGATPQEDEFVPGTHTPPAIGEVAKPLETVYWYFKGPKKRVPTIEELRGEVVLLHTWGYYCGPCIKHGVPYLVDLLAANEGRGVSAISLTVAVGDDLPDDHFVKVGREMGMDHPMGQVDAFGGMTPYVNLNESSALTWCFVIGRDGGVVWAGNPATDGDEFTEAVASALAREATPPLAAGTPEPLVKAVAEYVAGDLGKAHSLAAKAVAKYERKKDGDETRAVLEYGRGLLTAIDGHREKLVGRCRAAVESVDAGAWVAASRALELHFPKTPEAKELKAQRKELKADEVVWADVERWEAWRDLEAARPALFPARVDKDNRAYARKLERFVDKAAEGHPGRDTATAWLAAYVNARER